VTLEDAEQVFARSQAAWDGTRKVLRQNSKFREPTLDEIDLFLKWTQEWKFAPKAIEKACAEMTGGDPSFKYLDSILRGIHERSGRSETSAAQLEKQLSCEKEESAEIREVLMAAGLQIGANHPAMKESYRQMHAKVGHEAIVLAAREISRSRKNQSLEKLEELVDKWHQKGLQTVDDVKQYLTLVKKQNAFLQQLFTVMGAELAPSPADRELLSKWREDWAFSDEVLLEVAGYARGKTSPVAFMNKVLESFHKKGVRTVEAVRTAHEEHARESRSQPQHKRGKTVIEQQYTQREYNPADYEGFTPEEIEEMMKYDA
ncbi:MAG: DnaD domain protein, partial [Bacillota bacterium]